MLCTGDSDNCDVALMRMRCDRQAPMEKTILLQRVASTMATSTTMDEDCDNDNDGYGGNMARATRMLALRKKSITL